MIESLRIENLAIVEEAEIEFGPGLNVLTGETGTGKSIVLGALALIAGARGAAGKLREGAEQGVVEALFRIDALPELQSDLRERDLLGTDTATTTTTATDLDEMDEAAELVVRRTLSRAGRSRARVGGQMVPVSTLTDLFSGRVEISSQHSSQALLHPESHGRYLDAAGGLLPQRERVGEAFHELRRLDGEIEELRGNAEERIRRQDFLAFQLNEIDEVGLEPGELDELTREHLVLAHAENLRGEGASAVAALSGDDQAGDMGGEIGGAESGALDRIAQALSLIDSMAKLDPALEGIGERLRASDSELRDLASELERHVDGIEADPARLARLEERIAQVERLRRKYGRSESEIFDQRAALAAELEGIEGADSRVGELSAERDRWLEQLNEAAARLSEGRVKAGRKLSREVQRSLRELDMPEARFSVSLAAAANLASLPEGAASGPSGAEAPEFLFSANKGETPRSLQKVASGGELSRVFLALKNALRLPAGGPMVLVFDEVDAGIGGRAADRVGRVLAELASAHQVLCITHLPQIAAFADVHFRVEKSEGKGRTRVRISRIEGPERVEEIARMAGGDAISDSTRRHARDLMRAKTPS